MKIRLNNGTEIYIKGDVMFEIDAVIIINMEGQYQTIPFNEITRITTVK